MVEEEKEENEELEFYVLYNQCLSILNVNFIFNASSDR